MKKKLILNYKIENNSKISIYGNDEYKLGYIEDDVANKLLTNDDKFSIELVDNPNINEKKDDKDNLLKEAVIKYNIIKID